MWLFFAFILVPLIEIALFIQVGSLIGLWPTLAVVVLTAVLGTMLVRSQGLQTLEKVRNSLETGTDPSRALAHGVMILFSGFLLLTPGFFTDAIGFALLIPPVRDAVFEHFGARVVMRTTPFGTAPGRRATPHDTVIDGEFEEIDPDSVPRRPGTRPSGWTRR
ncbi:MAG: FxsA family protein [Pseudomonadota bacterium]